MKKASKQKLAARWRDPSALTAVTELRSIEWRFLGTPGWLGKPIVPAIPATPEARATARDELRRAIATMPYVDEVPGGLDLRGIDAFKFSRHDLHGFHFTGGTDLGFHECDLREAVLDGVVFYGHVGNLLDGASLRRARGRNCQFFGSARDAVFDEARFSFSSFAAVDLRGARFERASLRSCTFPDADLTHADLRGADLEHATLCGAKLDRTTDLRGARLVNAFVNDLRDTAGNIVAAAVDIGTALTDETTVMGIDPALPALEWLAAVLRFLQTQKGEHARALEQRVLEMRASLKTAYRKDWLEEVLAGLTPEERAFADHAFQEAMIGYA